MVVGDRLLYPDPTYRNLRRPDAAVARNCACHTSRCEEICGSNLARCRVVDRTSGRAFGFAARSHHPYLHRCRGCATTVGAAACALPSDLDHFFSNPSSDSALARYQCTTLFYTWFGHHVCCRLSWFDRLPNRDRPCCVFCMRSGLPRRAGAASAGASTPHHLLSVDLCRRIYRRHCYRPSRPSCV